LEESKRGLREPEPPVELVGVKQTDGLPRTTEAEQLVIQLIGQDVVAALHDRGFKVRRYGPNARPGPKRKPRRSGAGIMLGALYGQTLGGSEGTIGAVQPP
jgi:hypothetical protein